MSARACKRRGCQSLNRGRGVWWPVTSREKGGGCWVAVVGRSPTTAPGDGQATPRARPPPPQSVPSPRPPPSTPVSSPAAGADLHPASRGGAGVLLLLPPHSLTGEHPNPSHPASASASNFVSSPAACADPHPASRGGARRPLLASTASSLAGEHPSLPTPHQVFCVIPQKVWGFNRNRVRSASAQLHLLSSC
ncbi:hypothetical protein DAI22_07g261300 [Oryza sativa Japonica Group]|nr:hypothetical protein DAI22_07g261300 [Oryza sativa Japonica Group]